MLDAALLDDGVAVALADDAFDLVHDVLGLDDEPVFVRADLTVLPEAELEPFGAGLVATLADPLRLAARLEALLDVFDALVDLSEELLVVLDAFFARHRCGA